MINVCIVAFILICGCYEFIHCLFKVRVSSIRIRIDILPAASAVLLNGSRMMIANIIVLSVALPLYLSSFSPLASTDLGPVAPPTRTKIDRD